MTTDSSDKPLPLHVIARKVRSAGIRLEQFLETRRTLRVERAKARAFRQWLSVLQSGPPDVLVGSNFAEYGGVKHHIHAISKYSKRRVELAPPDRLLSVVQPHDIRTRFREEFLSFHPRGIASIHSHVFPWFIEWCDANRGSSRWIHTYHVPYFQEFSGRLAPWQEEINAFQDVAAKADVRISVSKWQQAYLRQTRSIETVYVPNGVDVGLCDLASASRFLTRHSLKDFVLFVGRNDPVKNPAAFLELATSMQPRAFAMVGRGLADDAIRAEFGISVPPNVTLLGELSHQATLDAISACVALVVTSRREGLPTLILEAMALQKPVVAPDEPGSAEVLENGRFGFLYDPDIPGDVQRKTEEAIGSAGRNDPTAREKILDEYDWRVIARKLDAIYRDGTPA